MTKEQELIDEIIWVMQHYGSDAGERLEPGSKLKSQAKRIAEFVRQRDEAEQLLSHYGLDMIRIARR